MLRFADVLLIYAEAANYVNHGPDEATLDAFDRVYSRGRGESSPYTLRTSQNEFDRAILEERAWEFACEGDRWHDLVRKEMVVAANAERFPTVKESARLLPKPGTEIIPGILDQNEY